MMPAGRESDVIEQSQGALVLDAVTGALSRASFPALAAAELTAAAARGGSCSVLLFDVDHFKSVNDSYGHARGDAVLRLITDRVRARLGESDRLIRYGGDEFVVLLPNADRAEAVRTALAVVAEVADQELPGDPPLQVSVSLGVATYPDDATDVAGLLEVADRRNYLAKRRGRGCAVADDADTAADAGVVTSRLLERETAMAAVNDLLTLLATVPVEGLAVLGPPGAGHTRFLTEVGRVARLRGFTVVDAADPEAARRPLRVRPGATGPPRVLILSDVGTSARIPDLMAAMVTKAAAVGVVYADTAPGQLTGPATPTRAIELDPWSLGSVRIWLRYALRGEPTERLVEHLHARSGGLPAVVERELSRLRRTGELVRDARGAWSVAVVQPVRRRRWAALPVPMTELVGRQPERDRVVALLESARLVTLTGPGGIGKTRLSLAAAGVVADRLPDGAVFVPLGELDRPESVADAVAAAVGADPVPGQAPLDTIAEHLGDAAMLLVLDNFEQVLDAAVLVADLLRRTPNVRVLATSRERLALYGERVYPVPPLPLPAEGALPTGPDAVERAMASFPALALFERCAQAVDLDFAVTADTLPTVTQVCRRLDGLPLAIELAAARADRWDPGQLLKQLDDHLATLADGPRDLPERQRTLRGAIDWSVKLLTPQEQRTFGRLAVFAGGFTVAEAADVTTAEPASAEVEAVAARLVALVDKSLVVARGDTEDGPRYSMLETVRAYAVDRLAGDPDAEAVWLRHAAHFGRLAEQANDMLTGPDPAPWVRRIEREYTNLRAAFATVIRRGDAGAAAGICLGLWRYWCDAKHLDEGRAWVAQLLADPKGLDRPVYAELLYVGAVIAHTQDDHDTAQALAERFLAEALALGDRSEVGRAYSALGMAAYTRGDYRQAHENHARSLAEWQEIGNLRGVRVGLGNLTKTALRLGDLDAAESYVAQRLAMDGAEDPRNWLLGLEDRIDIALARGEVAAAEALLAESRTLSAELKDVAGEAMAQHQSGRAAWLGGDAATALRLLAEALVHRHALQLHEDVTTSLEAVATVLADRDPVPAAELLGAADALRQRRRLPVPPNVAEARAASADTARRRLGDAGFRQAWERGRAAPLDLMVERARDAGTS